MFDLTLEGNGRIMPFYTVGLQAPEPKKIVKKAMDSQRFVGVKLYPHEGKNQSAMAIQG
jgi:hypothetical protein